ncbi:kinesin-like protein KIF14 [Anopheles bellator]|uniref:kinesin-like protein KIF14 n=1 Tax=Anopheles bellator TaxID=139047 RepID=UPI00264846F5|nr:kinesin-like protein KIF14 [Anopheles bellator]
MLPSRTATPKNRFGPAASSSPTKASTPRPVARPVGSKLATSSLTKRSLLNISNSDSLSASPAQTPKQNQPAPAGAGLGAKSKSSTTLNYNSCYTPSSLYRAPPASSKSASKDFGTPKNLLKRTRAREDLLNARTPECFSRISLDTPPLGKGRHCSSHGALNESQRSTKEKDKEAPGEISNLKVAVRIRPLSVKECIDSVANIVRVVGNELYVHTGSTADNLAGVENRFLYDHVLWSCNAEEEAYVDQAGVYNSLVHPLLDKAFEGYNTCLFAYGQTGSGKSYSMMGMDLDDNYDDGPNSEAGIIPRFCQALFARIDALKGRIHAEVEVSYFEIYNEKIHDLLSVTSTDGQGLCTVATPGNHAKKAPLKVREHPVWGPYVVDLSTHPVDTHTALRNWLAVGNSQRATAATGMNDKSSRSHSIFSVVLNLAEIVSSSDSDDASDGGGGRPMVQQTKRSKISLVDLAGSERVSQTCASGTRLKEGVSINKSLLTLGKVISALADPKKSHNAYIPYRDSVLTWLLRENLGGNSRTVMLATISPASIHRDETLATLRYACQARSIVNRVKVNEDPHDRIIRELRAEVERLQVLRQDYERQKRLSEANHLQPRKIIIETSVDDGEVEALRQQLTETEQELVKAQRSWRERLQEAEDVRRTEMKLLKRKGLALELSAEQKEPCLVNLATDPMLSGTLLYIIPPGTVRIGRPSSLSTPDIMLEGPLVSPNHCCIENKHGKLFLLPEKNSEYETFINGELVQERRQLFHGDRLVIGGSHYFRVSNPLCPNKSNQVMVDFQLAHQEILCEQENRLRRELDAEKQAAIACIEAERMAHDQEYEERLATLELEKFKYKCHKEMLESEQEALILLQSTRAARDSTDSGAGRQSDDGELLDGGELAFSDSNLAEEIRRIMEHTSEESLAQIQMLVKEAGQRCRDVGLDYEFKQTQVWQEEGIFRAVINIVDRANGRIAEWLPARLEFWLTVVRERDDLSPDNMFENFDLPWNDATDPATNESLLQEPQNSSRISLNLSSVKDAIFAGRHSLLSAPGNTSLGQASPSTNTGSNIVATSLHKTQWLLKSMFARNSTTTGSARKALFTEGHGNEENIPINGQQTSTSAPKTPLRFDHKAANYLRNVQVATLRLRKLCEKHQDVSSLADDTPVSKGEQSDKASAGDGGGKDGPTQDGGNHSEEALANRMLASIDDVERSIQNLRSILTEYNITQATLNVFDDELGRTPKSVRFLLD